MFNITNPPELDNSAYLPGAETPQAMYGLPRKIIFCNSCSYSNQKPNSEREFTHQITSSKPTVKFNEFGVCSACQIAEIKKKIDWQDREKMLQELCNRYRKRNGEYDCIVPGSGGKDSFYTSFVLKYKYNMNPLTVTWAPHIYTPWGWENFQSWINSGFDNHLVTPNGRVHRLLTRLALENIFHPFQPFIMGQMNMPPRMALQLDIPLVVYGENPVEYGNDQDSFLTSPRKDPTYFSSQQKDQNFIAGMPIEELIGDFGLSASDLKPYLPIDASRFNHTKLDVQYLGYYLPWHPQDLYYFAVENGGFKASPERTSGTYSKYSGIDDKIDDLHYYCTYIKFGIGRATYDSAQEIRNGEIERDEAVSLIRRYDGEYPIRFEKESFDYLSLPIREFPIASSRFETSIIDSKYFEELTNKFRSPHLWQFSDKGWELRKSIYASKGKYLTTEENRND